MGNSLRDQLLKAGFVDKKRAKQLEMEDKQKAKAAYRETKKGRAGNIESEAARRAREERELYAQRSRELNRAKEQEREKRRIEAQVRQWLTSAGEPHGKGDIRYHFVDGKKVKRLYVDRKQQDALSRGDLAIGKSNNQYYLVGREVADKIREQLPEAIVFLAEPEAHEQDDPYAEFPIPEDLEW